MKKLKPLAFFVILAGVWLLTSSDIAPSPYDSYTPYFMKRADLDKSVFYVAGKRDMQDPGKIWVRGSEIFVVERYKGVHIIDNSTPADPGQTGFIIAPGCMDVAVKGDIIYLDNAVDLVAFDLASKQVTERIRNFFPEPASPSGNRYHLSRTDMILVGWKKTN